VVLVVQPVLVERGHHKARRHHVVGLDRFESKQVADDLGLALIDVALRLANASHSDKLVAVKFAALLATRDELGQFL
jgi:hypothetical protein